MIGIDEFMVKYQNRNMPKTMDKFLNSIGVKNDIEIEEDIRERIFEFIERIKKLDKNCIEFIIYMLEVANFKYGSNSKDKTLEIEYINMLNNSKYDRDDLRRMVSELEKCRMCYIDNDYTMGYVHNDDTITLTVIAEYENFFYDLMGYCKFINVDIKEVLAEGKFNLLD